MGAAPVPEADRRGFSGASSTRGVVSFLVMAMWKGRARLAPPSGEPAFLPPRKTRQDSLVSSLIHPDTIATSPIAPDRPKGIPGPFPAFCSPRRAGHCGTQPSRPSLSSASVRHRPYGLPTCPRPGRTPVQSYATAGCCHRAFPPGQAGALRLTSIKLVYLGTKEVFLQVIEGFFQVSAVALNDVVVTT